jgi:DNA-binding MarR family transcriptional regulator
MNFQPSDFLPYLLNRAAEACSQDFKKHYQDTYGMLRTEWRVLFHLGSYGDMTAKSICSRASIHKTKVSRAVHALEQKRYLSRAQSDTDRRVEILSLTATGKTVFKKLNRAAERYDARLAAAMSPDDFEKLKSMLKLLAK